MTKEFTPYEPSLALKELGFDEPCISYYTVYGKFSNDYSAPKKYNSEFKLGSYISAPTYSQAFKWFRENYGLYSWVTMELGNKSTFCWVLSGEHTSTQYAAYFHTYEEAELACLNKLIEIVKNK